MGFIISYLIFNVSNLINFSQISSMFFFKNEKIQYLTSMFVENFSNSTKTSPLNKKQLLNSEFTEKQFIFVGLGIG